MVKRKKGNQKRVFKQAKVHKKEEAQNSPEKISLSRDLESPHRTQLKIIGVGGGGGNIVSEIAQEISRAVCVAANTDLQALKELSRRVKIFPFGQQVTGGLGSGMKPEIGEKAAQLEKERVKKMFEGGDLCVLIACLGGGTGSGAVPIFAQILHELRILSIGIFTMPFSFEGKKRKEIAEIALEKIKPFLNTFMVIPNDAIFHLVDKKTSLARSLSAVNLRLTEMLGGFIETIFLPGFINIDFADVRTLLEGRERRVYLHNVSATGADRVQEVVRHILSNPLCGYGIEGADRILLNITGDRNLKMQEVGAVSKAIAAYNPKAKIIFGISFTPKAKDALRVFLLAVGCRGEMSKKIEQKHSEIDKAIIVSKEHQPPNRKILQVKAQKGESSQNHKKTPVPEQKSQENSTKTAQASAAQAENSSNPKRKLSEQLLVRRNALDIKKAVEEEIQELEKKEKQWEMPAFLRNKSSS